MNIENFQRALDEILKHQDLDDPELKRYFKDFQTQLSSEKNISDPTWINFFTGIQKLLFEESENDTQLFTLNDKTYHVQSLVNYSSISVEIEHLILEPLHITKTSSPQEIAEKITQREPVHEKIGMSFFNQRPGTPINAPENIKRGQEYSHHPLAMSSSTLLWASLGSLFNHLLPSSGPESAQNHSEEEYRHSFEELWY
jgi:hypothetical protein